VDPKSADCTSIWGSNVSVVSWKISELVKSLHDMSVQIHELAAELHASSHHMERALRLASAVRLLLLLCSS
jgi:hypothetical protein